MANKTWHLTQQQLCIAQCIEKSPTVLGRSRKCDIVIDDPSLSGEHVQFVLDGKNLVVHDLRSTNGTFLEGKRIGSSMVKPADGQAHHLKVGAVICEVFYASKAQEVGAPLSDESDQDDAPQWFFAADGVEHGPLTLRELFAAVDRRALRPTDDLWQEGMPYRLKAFEVEGLFETANGDTQTTGLSSAPPRSGAIMCPYCWHRFGPEDVLFIAGHPDLLGDPVLGSDESQRYLPTRFTTEGLAIDAGGVVCPDMACPVCHMRLPATLISQPPLFMSIVGAPGSGKSYYLASAAWTLRTTLPSRFGLRFVDVDAVTNQWLNDYEERLFLQADMHGFQTIAKTELTAPTVSRQVKLNNMDVLLPLPSLFSLQADGIAAGRPSANRTVVLYDSAGEHFLAGQDPSGTRVTRHLAYAEGILFLFDPTEDPRFRRILDLSSGYVPEKMSRQDVLLIEMVGRIRKHLGMRTTERLKKTIIVGVSKADLLSRQLCLDSDPWQRSADGQTCWLDVAAVQRMSDGVRTLLAEHAPEIVTTVESFAESVLYMPNSALGHNPAKDGVRPCDIKPRWVEVPLLYILSRLGYVATSAEPSGR